MENPFSYYGKLLSLLFVVSAMVGFNFLNWGFHRPFRHSTWQIPGAHPERGPVLLTHYGCVTCHTVKGAAGTSKAVGPTLEDFHDRLYVAGTLPNTPPNLIRWIQDPASIRPQTAMPNLGVSADDARDLAAYLYAPEDESWTP